MLLQHLPYQVYNTSYDIAHRCVRTRRWTRTDSITTCRVCGTHEEDVVHVVLQCPALAAKVWPVLLRVLTEALGLTPDTADDGTFLLNLNLPNDNDGVATSLSIFRHVLVTTHLLCTNDRDGLPILALAECESALRQQARREYMAAGVGGQTNSKQRATFLARWMTHPGRVGVVRPNWKAFQWIPWKRWALAAPYPSTAADPLSPSA